MAEWTPKPKRDAATEELNLTGEEGFVLSRVDGSTSLKNLVAVTGLPEGRVKQILHKLVAHGAVEADAAPPPSAGGSGGGRVSPAARARPAPPPKKAPDIDTGELQALLDDDSQDGAPSPGSDQMTLDDVAPVGGLPTEDLSHADPRPSVPAAVALEQATTGPQIVVGPVSAPDEVMMDAPVDSAEASTASDDPNATQSDDEGAPEGEEGEQLNEVEEGNYRKLYEMVLSKLEKPEREALARTAEGAELMGLCFDPLHDVIRGIFENSHAGPPHARLVARHHRTPQGLDVVMNRAEFFRDLQVQRLLLQNSMLQDPQLRKLLQSKRLMDVYKVTINREIPERNRQKSRQIMRTKWATAEGEERAGMVFQTEGRVLTQLTGLPFDSQMTSILCGKTYTSVLLIQNLARFGACPPQLLSHLLKQPSVKRQAHLRTLILQHPNCPSSEKRKS